MAFILTAGGSSSTLIPGLLGRVTPAEETWTKAGLRLGDLVVACDQDKITDLNHMQRLLGQKSPSDRLRLKVFRRGRGFLHVAVHLQETPSADRLPAERDLF